MSLNKHDLHTHRRTKRSRALKIDLLIIVLFALAAIFIAMDHQPPRSGSPAFHKAETSPNVPNKAEKTGNQALARATN